MSTKMNVPGISPISALSREEAHTIRYVLMDIDDTLTTDGKTAVRELCRPVEASRVGLVVVPITGRPAGWCDLIAREWPVEGSSGKKWRFCLLGGRWTPSCHTHSSKRNPQFDPRLVALRERALAKVPAARLSRDQFSRLYDVAIDFAEEEPVLPLSIAQQIKAIFEGGGAHAKISSIHVNAWMGEYDKVSMAIHYLTSVFGYDDLHDADSVIFVGDSPNDEPMFAHFPMACGVANLLEYRELFAHLPHFVTSRESGAGFSEFAQVLLERRSS
jgi:3-deoxy-D-manno-octulosonate 8-phosphate phosphatase KdsC-like HAD superfamily phosphatase